jgi:hypothetical protein
MPLTAASRSFQIAALHPMYLVSIAWCALNFVARCTPSNFNEEFERVQEPVDDDLFVCSAVPAAMSWGLTFFTTLTTYTFALQSWPMMFPVSWFISYYTWFSSVYIFCVFVFPWCHRPLFAAKDNPHQLRKLTALWVILLYAYVGIFSVGLSLLEDQVTENWFSLSAYLFPPGWLPCFALGICGQLLFQLHRPRERESAWIWGLVTDCISAAFLAAWLFYGLWAEEATPDFLTSSIADRYWAALFSRMICPVGFLWCFGIAVGKSFTSWLFSGRLVLNWLAPASYNMFLFHQPVSEVYYRATRGEWWAYPEKFYWFSPEPFPVRGWEVPIVMGIVIGLSVLMETFVNEWLVSQCASLLNCWAKSAHHDDSLSRSVSDTVCALLADVLNHPSVTSDMGLVEVGMSSMTTIIVVSTRRRLVTLLH